MIAEIREELLRNLPVELQRRIVPLEAQQNALTAWQEAVEASQGPWDEMPWCWPAGEHDWPEGVPHRTKQELAAILAANERLFNLIDEGLARQRFQTSDVLHGPDEPPVISTLYMQTARRLARLIRLRAEMELEMGNAAAAVVDAQRLWRMGTLIGTADAMVIHVLIAYAILALGDVVAQRLADEGLADDAQLASLLSVLRRTPRPDAMIANVFAVDLCAWTLPRLVALALAQREGRLYKTYCEQQFDHDWLMPEASESQRAQRKSQSIAKWRGQLEQLLDGHPRPFDPLDTARLLGEETISAIGSVGTFPLPMPAWRIDQKALLAWQRIRLKLFGRSEEIWPEWTFGTPYEEVIFGQSEDQVGFLDTFRDMHPDILRLGSPAEIAAVRRNLRTVNNPLGRHFATRERPTRAKMAVQRGVARRRVLETMLALKLMELRNGCLPRNLEALVEAGLLNDVPLDPYCGKPLRYEPENRLVSCHIEQDTSTFPPDIDPLHNDLVWQMGLPGQRRPAGNTV